MSFIERYLTTWAALIIAGRGEIKIKPGVAMALRAANIDLRFFFEDQIF